jgi:hypothetical protein|tara:strand:+ start:1665 stop:1778 length:114 start_codon:yes stop_codon:yes gene_type:complete
MSSTVTQLSWQLPLSGAFHFVFKGSIQPETGRKPLDV